MRADEIINKYRSAGSMSSGELLLTPDVAHNVVKECTAEGVAVIGVEAFIEDSHGLRPLLDQIADYSSAVANGCDADCVRRCNQDAAEFITSLPTVPHMLVALVLFDNE